MSAVSHLLADAIEHHRRNRLEQAEALYRRILRRAPGNAEALHLYGLLAHQSGDNEIAAERIGKAVAINPRSALYRFNLGLVLAAKGEIEPAIESYREAVSLKPEFADAQNNLGFLLDSQGKADDALACFEQATRVDPGHAEAWVNLGKAIGERRKAGDSLVCFQRALKLNPRLAEAHFGVGKAFEDQGIWVEAEAAYRQALALNPSFSEAQNNLGTALLAQGKYRKAQSAFHKMRQLKRGPVCDSPDALGGIPDNVGASPGVRGMPRFKLVDRVEQLEYLLAKGLIDPSFSAVVARGRSLLNRLEAENEATGTLMLPETESPRFEGLCGSVIHYRDAPMVAGRAVDGALDCGAIEEAYLSSPASVVYFDAFLSRDALQELRRFCRESTIFFGCDPAGYVSSYISDGFNCSLLYQIASELKQRFPRVIGPQFLSNMWVYRHSGHARGVDAHTDYAAVSFNFWITPDAANLTPDRGGIVVYKKEQPLDWDWMEYNKRKNAPDIRNKINEFLGAAESITIPYRENRAVLFHSNLFHKSDEIRFRDGFANRRMNITMLFGERGATTA